MNGRTAVGCAWRTLGHVVLVEDVDERAAGADVRQDVRVQGFQRRSQASEGLDCEQLRQWRMAVDEQCRIKALDNVHCLQQPFK